MTLTTIITLNAILDVLVVVGVLALVARCIRPDYGTAESSVRPLPSTRTDRLAA
jgi:hypothetical protein